MPACCARQVAHRGCGGAAGAQLAAAQQPRQATRQAARRKKNSRLVRPKLTSAVSCKLIRMLHVARTDLSSSASAALAGSAYYAYRQPFARSRSAAGGRPAGGASRPAGGACAQPVTARRRRWCVQPTAARRCIDGRSQWQRRCPPPSARTLAQPTTKRHAIIDRKFSSILIEDQ